MKNINIPSGYIARYLILKRPQDRWFVREKIAQAEREIKDRKAELLMELDRLNKISDLLTKEKQLIMRVK